MPLPSEKFDRLEKDVHQVTAKVDVLSESMLEVKEAIKSQTTILQSMASLHEKHIAIKEDVAEIKNEIKRIDDLEHFQTRIETTIKVIVGVFLVLQLTLGYFMTEKLDTLKDLDMAVKQLTIENRINNSKQQ